MSTWVPIDRKFLSVPASQETVAMFFWLVCIKKLVQQTTSFVFFTNSIITWYHDQHQVKMFQKYFSCELVHSLPFLCLWTYTSIDTYIMQVSTFLRRMQWHMVHIHVIARWSVYVETSISFGMVHNLQSFVPWSLWKWLLHVSLGTEKLSQLLWYTWMRGHLKFLNILFTQLSLQNYVSLYIHLW